ncbi:MAG: NnrS family protein [Burkholderiales bacterium]|nr:NnrS family protein [Burkholderiales bacterium]
MFTAGRNWFPAGSTPTGWLLMALAALWLAARVRVLTPRSVGGGAGERTLPSLAAWGLWRALRAGGNQRNYFFVGPLCVLASVPTPPCI